MSRPASLLPRLPPLLPWTPPHPVVLTKGWGNVCLHVRDLCPVTKGPRAQRLQTGWIASKRCLEDSFIGFHHLAASSWELTGFRHLSLSVSSLSLFVSFSLSLFLPVSLGLSVFLCPPPFLSAGASCFLKGACLPRKRHQELPVHFGPGFESRRIPLGHTL